jgi:hypothetical protein
MKRPAFMFYPGDWLHDVALRMCSLGARGLWIDLMCVMHQGTPYGHLALQKNGDRRVISASDLAHMLGGNLKEVQALLDELENAAVFSRTPEGTIYSRRMVADEKLRETRASCGVRSQDNPHVPRPRINR